MDKFIIIMLGCLLIFAAIMGASIMTTQHAEHYILVDHEMTEVYYDYSPAVGPVTIIAHWHPVK